MIFFSSLFDTIAQADLELCVVILLLWLLEDRGYLYKAIVLRFSWILTAEPCYRTSKARTQNTIKFRVS